MFHVVEVVGVHFDIVGSSQKSMDLSHNYTFISVANGKVPTIPYHFSHPKNVFFSSKSEISIQNTVDLNSCSVSNFSPVRGSYCSNHSDSV